MEHETGEKIWRGENPPRAGEKVNFRAGERDRLHVKGQ